MRVGGSGAGLGADRFLIDFLGLGLDRQREGAFTPLVAVELFDLYKEVAHQRLFGEGG